MQNMRKTNGWLKKLPHHMGLAYGGLLGYLEWTKEQYKD